MVFNAISLRGRLATAGRAGRSAFRRLWRTPFPALRHGGLVIDRLLLSPRDLRTADPSFASEIYHGHFGLAGAVAMTGSESPFATLPPSAAWERELHGFGWLRHLSASGDEISREHARALVRDWMHIRARAVGIAWEPEILARRVISWLSHSRIFLEGADQRFYDAVMASLTRQVRHLYGHYADTPVGRPRLTALTALVLAELCTRETYSGQSRATRQFCEELDRQIFSDGGHVSRNPAVLVDLMLDLLPLRQCFVARDHPPPEKLVAAIERIMPMIRFFRMGDGSLARFNGCGTTPTDNLAAVLAHDETLGRPLTLAEPSGYCRLEHGGTVVVVDCGRSPPAALSGEAHAGTLAMEMSAGSHPVIVNCGAPGRSGDDWRQVARATAAHSTLVMNDTSSAQLSAAGPGGEGGAIIAGPANVTATLENADGVQVLRASHDGYDQRFGVTHARRLSVSGGGDTIVGEDVLFAPHGLKGEAAGNGAYVIRFHLHPSVSAEISADQRTARLHLPNRESWHLTARELPLGLEESVFLADHRGPRRTQQVVLYGNFSGGTQQRIGWILEKSADSLAAGADDAAEEAVAGEQEPEEEEDVLTLTREQMVPSDSEER